MDTDDLFRFVAHVDDTDDPSDLTQVLGLVAFVSGAEPWAHIAHLQRVRPDAALLPPGVTPHHSASFDNGFRVVLARGEGWTLLVRSFTNRTAIVQVTAVSEEVGRPVLEAATADAVEPVAVDEGRVAIGFWHQGARGPTKHERAIATAPWSQIRTNYAGEVGAALERLLGMAPGRVPGRLLLLHGPPGTGKTTALRALAHAWRSWCDLEYVIDPERLLAASGYLMHVALQGADRDGDDEPRRWRMLVLEDCDELIRSDAKESTGQSLSRLLNLTDGVIGQGLDVLVCITTNEPLSRLHPAIVRPGRCLAQIHVGRLPRREAIAWLGTSEGIGHDGATLAELFALRGELDQIEAARPDEPIGLYL
jgi:hypothetical protein